MIQSLTIVEAYQDSVRGLAFLFASGGQFCGAKNWEKWRKMFRFSRLEIFENHFQVLHLSTEWFLILVIPLLRNPVFCS